MIIKKASGNNLIFEAEAQPEGVGYLKYRVEYGHKNGRLQLLESTYKVTGYLKWPSNNSQKFAYSNRILQRNVTFYKDKQCKKKSVVLKKGQRIIITKMYVPGIISDDNYKKKISFYAKGKGWFNVGDYSTKGELFEGAWYAE